MPRIGFPEVTVPGTTTLLLSGSAREVKAAKLVIDRGITSPYVTVRVTEVYRSKFTRRVQVRVTLTGDGPALTNAVAIVLSLDHATL